MAFLKKLRTSIGHHFLNKELTKIHRNPVILNIKDIKTVGIVFCADDGEEIELLKKYAHYLQEMGKTVKAIGYISKKKALFNRNRWPEPFYLMPNEINWFYKPDEQLIANFAKEPLDLLIDTGIKATLPLMFITALSKANYKVGRYSEKHKNVYDVMLEVDHTKTLKYFLRNVDLYMDMLNK